MLSGKNFEALVASTSNYKLSWNKWKNFLIQQIDTIKKKQIEIIELKNNNNFLKSHCIG